MRDGLWRIVSFFLLAVTLIQFYLLLSSSRPAPTLFESTPYRPQLQEQSPQELEKQQDQEQAPESSQDLSQWSYSSVRDAHNIGLSQSQCDIAFPSLFDEINRARDYWSHSGHKITLEDTDISWRRDGAFKILIHNNTLRILQSKKAWVPYNYRKRMFYTLLQMHRALQGALATGQRLPDIEFAATLDDMSLVPGGSQTKTIWAYTRELSDKVQEKLWLMPDFQFGASPPYAGSFGEMQEKAAMHDGPLSSKIQKAVWRGRVGTNKDVRPALLKASEGKDWADVIDTGFGAVEDEDDMISMDNLCRYAFVLHTEGRSWSGRLKYLLNCHSVPIVHKLHWTASYYSLLRPSGPEQNHLQVERDFSDLGSKVQHLIDHPEEAQRIADNARATFRERYTSPAAEACYWRELIRGYASVAFEPETHEMVDVMVSGRKEQQRHLRGWSVEQFLWNDEENGIGWNYQNDHP